MTNRTCPICEAGQLHAKFELIDVEYAGHHGSIESHFSVCDACGSEQSGAVETRLNKRAMIEFKKEVQGLLTGTAVREIRRRMRLNQDEAAKVFGGGPVAFSKYENDDVIQSDAMDKLLRLADHVPAAFEKLIADSGIKRKEAANWENVAVLRIGETPRKTKTQVVQLYKNELEARFYG